GRRSVSRSRLRAAALPAVRLLVLPRFAPRFARMARRAFNPPPRSRFTSAYPLESAPANERPARLVLRGRLGRGLCGDEDRPAVRAAFHLSHLALRLRSALPRAGRSAVAPEVARHGK